MVEVGRLTSVGALRRFCLWAFLEIAVSGASAFAEPIAAAAPLSSTVVAEHTKKAKALAGDLYLPVEEHLCHLHTSEDEAQLAVRRKTSVLQPTKVFDNFYYVGAEDVAAWALKTSDGIILFDSLHNPEEAKADIIGGLSALGLDPARVRYVVITHGHGDHFGGAQYLKNTLGARLVASTVDWDFMGDLSNVPSIYQSLRPERDIAVNDGDTLSLGGDTITFHLTPGHTPGTLSTIFTVNDHGRSRTVAFWGGVGLRSHADEVSAYIKSDDAFRAVARSAGAEIGVTNHPHADMTLEWVSQMHGQEPASRNPLVVGPANVDRWLNVIEECAKAQLARLQP